MSDAVNDKASRRAGAAVTMVEVKGINTYYGDTHVLFDVSKTSANAR
jgi:hypothetical protein